MDSAERRRLGNGPTIRVVTAVYFCATKLAAFRGRGGEDHQASHDLEDLLAVIDGRPELSEEVAQAPDDVRSYIRAELAALLRQRAFLDALPGYLLPDQASQARIGILLQRLCTLAGEGT